MNNNALIIREKSSLEFTFTPDALALRESALSRSALIGDVTNAAQNAVAVEAQRELKSVINLFERERRTVKEPLLEAGRALDRAVALQVRELDSELGRISQAVAEFQLAEQRRIREERELQRRELERLAAEREAALAHAQTEAERERIEEEAAAKMYAEAQPIASTRTEGQVIRSDWEITVVNPWELAKFHPDCVTITPKKGQIKAWLNDGVEVRGVKATRVTKASVRTSKRAGEIINL